MAGNGKSSGQPSLQELHCIINYTNIPYSRVVSHPLALSSSSLHLRQSPPRPIPHFWCLHPLFQYRILLHQASSNKNKEHHPSIMAAVACVPLATETLFETASSISVTRLVATTTITVQNPTAVCFSSLATQISYPDSSPTLL